MVQVQPEDTALKRQFHHAGRLGILVPDRDALVGDVHTRSQAEIERSLLGLPGGSVDRDSRIELAQYATSQKEQIRRQRERQRKDREAFFAALLDQLDRDIAEIQGRIDSYNEQIHAIEELIRAEQNGGIDPTDPEHRKILRRAGIPEEEWGTVTLEDLEAHKEQLEAAKDDAQDALANKRAQKEELSARIAEISNNSPSAQQEQQLQIARDMMDETVSEIMGKRPQVIQDEAAWFKFGIEKLKIFETQQEYLEKLDIMIAGLSEDTAIALISDTDSLIDSTVKDRIQLNLFQALYSELQEIKDDPAYLDELKNAIANELTPSARQALLEQEGLRDDLRQALTDLGQEASTENQQANGPSISRTYT